MRFLTEMREGSTWKGSNVFGLRACGDAGFVERVEGGTESGVCLEEDRFKRGFFGTPTGVTRTSFEFGNGCEGREAFENRFEVAVDAEQSSSSSPFLPFAAGEVPLLYGVSVLNSLARDFAAQCRLCHFCPVTRSIKGFALGLIPVQSKL